MELMLTTTGVFSKKMSNFAEIEDNEAIVMKNLEVDIDRILDEQMQETEEYEEENDDDTENPIPSSSTA